MSDDPKVIQLPGTEPLPEVPFDIERSRADFCQHERIVLDEHDRSVHCAKCGKAYEPFAFLVHEANLIRSAWVSHQSVRLRIDAKQAELVQLTREVDRLKAQLKRTRDKLGATNVRTE